MWNAGAGGGGMADGIQWLVGKVHKGREKIEDIGKFSKVSWNDFFFKAYNPQNSFK